MARKFSLIKGKSIFIVDIVLIPLFILLIYSGLKLHYADHQNEHHIWEYWAEYHVIVSIILLVAIWLHVKAHWSWYKTLVKKGIQKKSKITIGLSILFIILIMTGILLVFFIDGGNSHVGLFHYWVGLLMVILSIIHIISRFHLLVKGLGLKKHIKSL